MSIVAMPRLSDSMEEGTVVRWLIADGAEVAKGDELVEIETDKATMAFEAEFSGTLQILVAEGETVRVGTPLATVGDAADAAVPATPVATPVTAVAAPAPTRAPAGVADPATRPKASPLARRLARESGVDVAALTGSGPGGRVVRRDIEAAVRGETQPLTRIQETVARRMAEAKATVPEFTVSVEVDMDRAVELRELLKRESGDVVPSFNDIVVKACAVALRGHPRANGSYRDGAFVLHDRVHVGVAVAAPDTLLVPVIADADRKSLGEIARDSRRLAERARDGAITPPELSGATFTVSNLGMYGVTQFTAVINPPQAAILAVGTVQRRPVVRGDEVVAGHQMTITLTSDHRILYGADAAAFLADVRAMLEEPLRLAL